MTPRRKKVTIVTTAVIAAAFIAPALIWRSVRTAKVSSITGAVLTQDSDPVNQRPIEGAQVTVQGYRTTSQSTSDSAGYFDVRLEPPVEVGEMLTLSFHHPAYKPFAMATPAGEQIHVIRLIPAESQVTPASSEPEVSIANVRVRYATKTRTTVNIGSAARTFQVVNTGNVPCNGQHPCSPDGRWKATITPISLDTGEDKKVFRNARVSCIAGPCPFSRIETDRFSRGGRVISVAVRNWSDPVTYLLEAEVTQTMESDLVRHSYPVIFGRSMNFTLPGNAQGPAIEAELGGTEIVFPLGPKLLLSWANCRLETGSDGTKHYYCELKPGYRFS